MAMSEALKAKFSEYELTLLIDKSGSMLEPAKSSNRGGPTRFKAVQETCMTLARDMAEIDSNGIGFVFFSGTGIVAKESVTPDMVSQFFADNQPRGSTPLAEALTAALALPHGNKKRLFVVFTDGAPDDEQAVANVIKNQANSQAADEDCTILFIQVGDDAEATKFLTNLDDNLTGAKFDIVDVKTVAEVDKFATTVELLEAALLG